MHNYWACLVYWYLGNTLRMCKLHLLDLIGGSTAPGKISWIQISNPNQLRIWTRSGLYYGLKAERRWYLGGFFAPCEQFSLMNGLLLCTSKPAFWGAVFRGTSAWRHRGNETGGRGKTRKDQIWSDGRKLGDSWFQGTSFLRISILYTFVIHMELLKSSTFGVKLWKVDVIITVSTICWPTSLHKERARERGREREKRVWILMTSLIFMLMHFAALCFHFPPLSWLRERGGERGKSREKKEVEKGKKRGKNTNWPSQHKTLLCTK